MTTRQVLLSDVCLDAGTQIRAALDPQVVTDYATAMQQGTEFPPVAVFCDGERLVMGDGFHRHAARAAAGFPDVLAHVYDGTTADALWFALGANRMNGQRLSELDKQRAIKLAFATWPEKSQREIADHVGCSQQFVSQVTSTCDVQREPQRFAKITKERADAIAALLNEGLSVRQVARQLQAGVHTVARVRDRRGLKRRLDNTPTGAAARRERMRAMAAEGYTSRQIAAAVGMTFTGCREAMKNAGIEVPADVVVGKTLRHKSTRIVERIVLDAENLTDCVGLIDYADLDRSQLAAWVASLKQARESLSAFIRRLMEESHHGEAA